MILSDVGTEQALGWQALAVIGACAFFAVTLVAVVRWWWFR